MSIAFLFCQGLKTGMYYLRTKAAVQAIQFTVDKSKLQSKTVTTMDKKAEAVSENNMAAMMCSLANKEECLMCSG